MSGSMARLLAYFRASSEEKQMSIVKSEIENGPLCQDDKN